MKKWGMIKIAMCGALISGCQTFIPESPNDPDFAPVDASQMRHKKAKDGSIYSPHSSMALFETIRARRVGDILTIVLQEQTTGQTTARTIGRKNDSVEASNPTLFGQPVNLGSGYNLSMSMSGEREFTGEGDSRQDSRLDGKITVTVYDVLPNGYLKIRGEKWVRINAGKEFIRLKGIVRPADIAPDNTISSSRVANARIFYGGTGQMNETNAQGWLARFFNSRFWIF